MLAPALLVALVGVTVPASADDTAPPAATSAPTAGPTAPGGPVEPSTDAPAGLPELPGTTESPAPAETPATAAPLVGPSAPATPAPRSTPPTPASPLNIMILGDSVTQGSRGDYTWRYRFWQYLTAQGVAFDFVGPWNGLRYKAPDGSVTHYADGYKVPGFDQDHASKWGLKLSDIPGIAGWTTQYGVDTVVMALGVNDMLMGATPAATAQLMEQRLVEMRTANPELDILIAPPTQTWVAGVPEFSRLLGDIAARLDTPDARARVAPAPAVYQKGVDTWDSLHPNAEGEVRIARAVAEGMVDLGVLRPIRLKAPTVSIAPSSRVVTFTVATDPWADRIEVFVRDRARPSTWLPATVRGSAATFTGASASTRYDVRVVTSARGVRAPVITVPFAVPAPLPGVQGTTVTSTKADVVTSSAQRVAGATGYQLYWHAATNCTTKPSAAGFRPVGPLSTAPLHSFRTSYDYAWVRWYAVRGADVSPGTGMVCVRVR